MRSANMSSEEVFSLMLELDILVIKRYIELVLGRKDISAFKSARTIGKSSKCHVSDISFIIEVIYVL